MNFISSRLTKLLYPTDVPNKQKFYDFQLNSSVLDIGCGAGILAEGLASSGFTNILGIDPTPKCIELAQAHLDDNNPLKGYINYRNMSLEDLILERKDNNQKFDLVCCSEVIEHVSN